MTKLNEFQETLEAFSTFLMVKGRKPSTIQRYVYDIQDFGRWLQDNKKFSAINTWENLSLKDYQAFFWELEHNRKYSPKTQHRIWVVLKKFHKFLNIESPLEDMEFTLNPDRSLKDDDFISSAEEQRLKNILTSLKDLTEKQALIRPLLMDRNVCIVNLLLDYGLSLQELVALNMSHIQFGNNTMLVPGEEGGNRVIILSDDDKKQLYKYYKNIPEPVRPRHHSDDPLFVAFDFNRGTFRWVYENDAPKALTEVAVQKMIRLEVARAGLRKGISAQQLRNTFIMCLIKQGLSEEEIVRRVGFKTKLSLKRYYQYVECKNA
ncbi:integrase [Bacillus sp. AFS098217]|uniref:tyrosine-type recombinase/integrase n=1 Tax=Bacillus sp. AFS098217 TaxID=2033868 RepID=UPI000BEC3CFA|nr:site-specific integrase [Bacillus sp. AFS098217]PEB54540.1 integrase [Bacillus sp. AFS098217]